MGESHSREHGFRLLYFGIPIKRETNVFVRSHVGGFVDWLVACNMEQRSNYVSFIHNLMYMCRARYSSD